MTQQTLENNLSNNLSNDIKNVLGVFDGMSCGQIALNNLGIQYDNYFASEIDPYAMKVTQANFPNTIQIGDIRDIKAEDLPKIDLLIGGSPCQGFSFAGKGLNFEDPRSKLFFEFVRLLKELKPKYWLLENVRMKKEVEYEINKILGCKPYRINSSLVSAQNRRRLYWTNIKINSLPQDQRIMLKDILQPIEEVDEKYFIKSNKQLNFITKDFRLKKKFTAINPQKALTLTAKAAHNWTGNYVKLSKDLKPKKDKHKASCLTGDGNSGGNHSDMDVLCVAMRGRNIVNGKRADKKGAPTQQRLEFNESGKSNCLTTVQKDNLAFIYQEARGDNKGGRHYDKTPTLTTNAWEQNNILADNYILRRLTPIECERLQTVPDNYTNHVCDTQRYKMLGNGWTVKVVEWILRGI